MNFCSVHSIQVHREENFEPTFHDGLPFTATKYFRWTQLDRGVKGKLSKCHIVKNLCRRQNELCVNVDTIYMVTIIVFLVPLEPFIGEYLCYFWATFEALAIRVDTGYFCI